MPTKTTYSQHHATQNSGAAVAKSPYEDGPSSLSYTVCITANNNGLPEARQFWLWTDGVGVEKVDWDKTAVIITDGARGFMA